NKNSTDFENLYSFEYSMSVNAFCKLIQMGNYDAVKALIEGGIDVNQKSMGLTPLMFAARHNKVNITKLLIKNGAKLKVRSDRKNITALKWAELSNAKDTYKVIKEALEDQKGKKRKR
ncbi:ankyrin repeat domain-containing protein, partial [bacterium AH-315-A23]|nr:ankyrin repeat domain-containing protein [bacterium AH-315-A23]